MPLVDFVCDTKGCSHKPVEELFGISEEYKKNCPKCGKPMRRIFDNPAKFEIDFVPGFNRGAGAYFDTKKQQDNYFAEHGLRRIR